MNRIDRKFKELKAKKKKALIIYIATGDPDIGTTEKIVYLLDKCGADIVELGVPFSDPMADGPTIQAASERALKNHVSLNTILKLVKRVRSRTDIPIALMTYYNPVFRYGVKRFVSDAKVAGVDGIIVPDLPPEEAGDMITSSRANDFKNIFLLAPTSSKKRIDIVSKKSGGFIYYVSLTGVTGARKHLPSEIAGNVRRIKSATSKPVCVGFGISTPSQAKALAKTADGVIVGSAVIRIIEKNLGKADTHLKVGRFIKSLSKAVKSV